MHIVVYLPLLAPIVAACAGRWLSERLEPRLATWLLTGSAVLLAGASGVALSALAATAIGQVRAVATLGHWSVRVLRRDDPASLSIALVACLLLAAALAALTRAVGRWVRALADAARTARCLPDHHGLAVLDDPAPQAYALPGSPGRIVVSTGMLRALKPAERRVLLAHEHAHLTGGHHLFVTAARLAAATNPLLRPLATAVTYTVERWADEHAARAVADRQLVARTIGKAALLTARHRRAHPMALAIAGLHRSRGLGPVPRRVVALLAAPPHHRTVLLAFSLAVLTVATVSAVEICHDLDSLFDLARAAHR